MYHYSGGKSRGVNFDIVFYVHRKCGLTKVILNIEPQKDEPSKYPILNRGIFYVSRLISSQKYRDFKGQEYGDICEVYSVWICMNMPENSMCHIHLPQINAIQIIPEGYILVRVIR